MVRLQRKISFVREGLSVPLIKLTGYSVRMKEFLSDISQSISNGPATEDKQANRERISRFC